MPLLAGSREEETRAQQEEAGQEVSGSSAGGFLSFARSCSHAGVPTVRFLEVIWVARSEAWGCRQVPQGTGYSHRAAGLGVLFSDRPHGPATKHLALLQPIIPKAKRTTHSVYSNCIESLAMDEQKRGTLEDKTGVVARMSWPPRHVYDDDTKPLGAPSPRHSWHPTGALSGNLSGFPAGSLLAASQA